MLKITSLFIVWVNFLIPFSAQEKNTHSLFIKFSNYSVEQDQLIQAALKDENVVYTCIPGGIMVIETKLSPENMQLRISEKLIQAKISSTFEFIDDFSIEQAEISCSSFRKLD